MKAIRFFVLILSIIVWGESSWAWSQARLVSKGARPLRSTHAMPWKKALRVGGRSYIVPVPQVGTEILRGTNRSLIGTEEHVRLNQTSHFFRPLGATLSRYIAQQIVKPQQDLPAEFAGYYTNFPKFWKDFKDRTHSQGGRLEVILEAAYGEAKFAGRFVATFDEVSALANTPVLRYGTARDALKQALAQAEEIRHGFFVIRVAGNSRRPTDTLLLDLANVRFISYNRSRANAWSQVITERTQPDEVYEGRDAYLNEWKKDPSLIDRRATQGIILRINGKNLPKDISVSLNGHSWTTYHLNAKDAYTSKELEQGLNIWTAWNKGYYILEDNDRWLFASEPGKPLFATPREVDEYLLQQQRFKQ